MKGRMEWNPERRRVEVAFTGKPDRATRATLKTWGFWWDRDAGVWYLARPRIISNHGEPYPDPNKQALLWVGHVVTGDRDAVLAEIDADQERAGVEGMLLANGII